MLWERRKCWLPAFSPFLTMFSKSLFFNVDKTLINVSFLVNSLPNNNILDSTNFKAFVDDKLYVAKLIIFLLKRLVNIVGKGENASIFLLFNNVLKMHLPQIVKNQDCVVKGKSNISISEKDATVGNVPKRPPKSPKYLEGKTLKFFTFG